MLFVRNTLQYLLGDREGFLDEVLILQHLEKTSITCTRAVLVRWHILSNLLTNMQYNNGQSII
jgi:hypothetical protein